MYSRSENELKVTSVNTISAIILKELRLERKIHQALLAERVNKSASAWSKIENGKASIDIALLYKSAVALEMSAIDVLSVIDRYGQFLSAFGFQILLSSSPETDDLRDIADEYYKSPGHKLINSSFGSSQGVSVQGGPTRNLENEVVCLDVFRCAIDSEYREVMNDKNLKERPRVPHLFSSSFFNL